MAHHRTRLWKNDRGNLMYRLYISTLPKNVFRFRGIVIFFRCTNSTKINMILPNFEAKRLSCALKHVFKCMVTCVQMLDNLFSDAG